MKFRTGRETFYLALLFAAQNEEKSNLKVVSTSVFCKTEAAKLYVKMKLRLLRVIEKDFTTKLSTFHLQLKTTSWLWQDRRTNFITDSSRKSLCVY